MSETNQQVTEGPRPGSPEYVAAMVAKAEAAGVTSINEGKAVDLTPKAAPDANASADVKTTPAATEAAKPQKPEGVPDKFWDAATGQVNFVAWAKSTSELEKQFTQSRQQQAAADPKPADQTPPTITDPQTPEQKAAAEAAAKAAQVDPVAAAQEARTAAEADMQKDGKISDESYAKLAKAGWDRATVDNYVAGQRASQTLYLNSLYDSAGGKDAYAAMIKWAPSSYSQEEVQAFDAAIKSGNPGTMKLAVAGLKARFAAEFGTSGKPVVPNNGDQNSTGAGFKSQAEVTAAMRDPRWSKDPAYRREVTQKIQAGELAGHNLGLNVMQSGKV